MDVDPTAATVGQSSQHGDTLSSTSLTARNAASTAPALPPRRPSVQAVSGTDTNEAPDGCGCKALDPALVESAWEQAAAVKTRSGHGSAKNGSSVKRSSPLETLDLRIFCGTWNVAGRMIDDYNDIAEWLDAGLDAEEGESPPPDMFVIGFQEVVELSAQNVVMDSFLDTQSKANSLKWFTMVYAYLALYGQRHGMRYVMLSEQRLLGTYVLIMVSSALCPRIGSVQSAAIPTGLGGFLGNKGAVAIRMEVAGSTSLCFVCVHMTAHREQVEARNAEYRLIASRLVFADTNGRLALERTDEKRPGGWGGLFGAANQGGMSPSRNTEVKKAIRAAMAFGIPKTASSKGAAATSRQGDAEGLAGRQQGQGKGIDGAGSSTRPLRAGAAGDSDELMWITSEEGLYQVNGLPKTKTVLQADIVFWLGDLNYRIVEDVTDADVLDMIQNGNLEKLRKLDQLNVERTAGRVFSEFQEGPLCFPPTYKYIPGTRDYDNRSEKKFRCPSWCDRVLYSVGMYGGDSVRRLALDKYWSSGPLLSDHTPVSALFRTSLTCAPAETIAEPEIDVEPLSPRRAAAKAAFELAPFPRIALDPPAVALTLPSNGNSAAPIAVTAVTNIGGTKGAFHVCGDSRPAWLMLEGGAGVLEPGETAELKIVVNVAGATVAAEQSHLSGWELPAEHRSSACAVLRVEVDGGGAGMLLPVVCKSAEYFF